MKVIILDEYYDKQLERAVKVSEVLDLEEDRIEALTNAGIKVKRSENEDESENEEELEDEDESENEEELGLIEAYRNDKNIVDGLKADQLKMLCEEFGVTYTNASDAKTVLKIVTLG